MTDRKYLTPTEVDQLLNYVKSSEGKFRFRDRTLILLMFRHGLRRLEASQLKWADINFAEATIYIKRVKGSKSGSHPIEGDELRLLRRLHRENTPGPNSGPPPWVFMSRQKQPLHIRSITRIIKEYGSAALGFNVTPKSLRHACGYYLANKGYDTRLIQEYLGHRNIQNTEIYTALNPNRINGLWE